MKLIKAHIVIILFLFAPWLYGQTKIAVPAAKVEFSELGNQKRNLKKQKKEARLMERFQKRKIKAIKKTIRKQTNLPLDSINRLTMILPALDSIELEAVQSDLIQITDQAIPTTETFPVNPDAGGLSQRINEYQTISSIDTINFRDRLPSDVAKGNLPGVNFELDSLRTMSNTQPNDSLVSSLIEQRIVNYFEETTSEKVGSNLGFVEPSIPDGSQVKQYIPSLEKFNYQKPEIPEDDLAKAMLESQVQRKKDELNPFQHQNEKQGNRQRQRIKIGGYAQYRPTPQSIELTPSISYLITRKWLVGAGYVTNIPLKNDSLSTRQKGMRLFLEYAILNGYFFHLESEWMTQKQDEKPELNQRSTYLGVGKTVRFKSVSSDILLLYNFGAPNQLQQKQVSIRFGLNFTK